MNNTLNIQARETISKNGGDQFILLFAVAALTCTFLRISLLIIYPVLVLLIGLFYRWKMTSAALITFALIAISLMLSFTGGIFLKYKLLSLYYILPLIALIFAGMNIRKGAAQDSLRIFMKCLAVIVLINDVVGLVQIAVYPKSDDNFTGIYSEFSVSLNGLTLMNAIIFFYYFMRYNQSGRYIFLSTSIFFLICSILGFYGAGVIVCTMAFIFSFFSFRFVSVFKTLFITLITIGFVYVAMLFIKPSALRYNIANIKNLASFDAQTGPRKLKAFYNYAISYPRDWKDLLFGSGPGTFNSRSAFMVGSPAYFTKFQSIKDSQQPYYFKNYAYTLWNDSNTSQALYLDGFRNQPFSSLLAFLGEYGLIFTSVFFLFLYNQYKKMEKAYRQFNNNHEAEIYFRTYKFSVILLGLLFVIDNFFEYPEVMLPIILLMRFSYQGLFAMYHTELKN